MIRRLLVVFAVLAASVVGAVPVSAGAGTQVLTVHFSSVEPPFIVPIPCSSLAGFDLIHEDNGNGVMHFTANVNGFWATGTYEGHLILTHLATNADGSPGAPDGLTAQGHVADWFGISFNKTVAVQHDAVNAQVTTSDGQAITFHMVDHINAIPQPFPNPPIITHSFTDASCH